MSTCSCAAPPGGTVTCPDNCFPYCEIDGGRVNGGCSPLASDDRPLASELRGIVESIVASVPYRQSFSNVEVTTLTIPEVAASIPWHGRNTTQVLARSMDVGEEFQVAGVRTNVGGARGKNREFVISLRFPRIWSRSGGSDFPSGGGVVAR